MKRTRVMAAMMAAAAVIGMLVPASVEAGVFRRRCDGEPRAFVKLAKAGARAGAKGVKAVKHPFGLRCRKNQRGALCGSF